MKEVTLPFNSRAGQSLIELLMTIALASIVIPALLTAFVSTREGRAQQDQRLQAVFLLQEAQEAVRSVREKDWTTFATNGTFYPSIIGSSWVLLGGTETINGFVRQIVVSDVRRDASGKVVQTGGTIDPSSKKITISVSWNLPLVSIVTSTAYLTRHNNQIYIETTAEEFNAGTKTGVAVTNTDGGEIVLGAGGSGDWCRPNLSIAAVDLPKQGIANAITAIEGKVFAGTGENASGVSFANVSIGNTNPPSGTITGTFDGYKTNGVFGETNYAYLATDNNFKEIVIIDLTQKDANNKYLEAGFFNAPGNGNGNSIFVSGNIGYMTSGDKLYTFDLSSKSGSRPQLGSVGLAGTGNRVNVVGDYAYIAIDSATTQMQIIEVGNGGRDLTVVGQAAVNGQVAKDIFVNNTGTRAYIVTASSSTQSEFFVIDVSTKTGSRSVLGSYDTSGMNPKGVTVVTGNRAIVVGTNSEEYQVINITNEANPNQCGNLSIDTGINGITAVIESDGDAFSYIITGDGSSELKIIEGGPGGQYASSGVFESKTFDASSEAAFNKFSATVTKPPSTDITFQIGLTHAISGSCDNVTFTFVGPDKTSSTFYTSEGEIPFDNDGYGFENPGRCLRYRAYLTASDASQTPILYDITFSYSP